MPASQRKSEKPIDVVIPLGDGSTFRNDELRFSLRSLDLYGRGVRRVVILGKRPSFLTSDVDEHFVADDRESKYRNVGEKYAAWCEESPEPWIMWNDDFFLARELDLRTIPAYYSGTVLDFLSTWPYQEHAYYQRMQGVQEHLERLGVASPLNFELHVPMRIDPEAYLEFVVGTRLPARTIYGNLCWKGPLEERKDVKFASRNSVSRAHSRIQRSGMFSCGDGFLEGGGKEILRRLYERPSRWENRTFPIHQPRTNIPAPPVKPPRA